MWSYVDFLVSLTFDNST